VKNVIAVIGTRRRDNKYAYEKVEKKFFELYNEGDWIVSGGCGKGGDRFAEKIAKKYGIPILTIYPNYEKYGRAAPIIRNTEVVKNADIVLACVIRPEEGIVKVLERTTGGTEDSLKKFVTTTDYISKVFLV